MALRTKLRVNFTAREIELSGDDESVREWYSRLSEVIGGFRAGAPPVSAVEDYDVGEPDPRTRKSESSGGEREVPFGEFLQRYPGDVSDVDRVLIAGVFAQRSSDDDSFRTGQVNTLLQQQGYKVANASECVRRNVSMRRVFTLKKGVYRVSEPGRQYLEEVANGGSD